jgi:hypothetical protein
MFDTLTSPQVRTIGDDLALYRAAQRALGDPAKVGTVVKVSYSYDEVQALVADMVAMGYLARREVAHGLTLDRTAAPHHVALLLR